MKTIGFSHGVLFKVHDVYTKENIQLFIDCGCTAIEINLHHSDEIDRLEEIIESIKSFSYISIHAPGNIRYGNNPETIEILKKIEKAYKKIDARLVVVHPDLVDDWNVFDEFKINWAIENMDDRKENFKDVKDIREFFSNHSAWGLVLDVGHCNVNDKTMVLAEDMIREFKNKIKEIHLSGYEVFHDPLHRTKQIEIIKVCKTIDVPIVIESTFEISDGKEGVKKEFYYIIENLK